ncbi:unnamed protein product [Aureobasidium uvarum]|uniref:Uncharacterized protein n=1 Tax=Aureobasidium uvarum TaxID=2773716 RepID=A0A9N8PXL2_9PEZI|nr:unnamed protein product [Aureobasidium uvarum]
MDNFGLGTVVDIASHLRTLTVLSDSSASSGNRLERQQFLIRYAVMLKTFQKCVNQIGIPARKFLVHVQCDDSMEQLDRFLRDTVLFYRGARSRQYRLPVVACEPSREFTINITMGDRLQSIKNMDQFCKDMEERVLDYLAIVLGDFAKIRGYYSEHKEMEGTVKEGKQVLRDTWIRVREIHLPLIDIAMQYWEDENEQELEDACRRLRWKEVHESILYHPMEDQIAEREAVTSVSSSSLRLQATTLTITGGLGSLGRLPSEIRNSIYSFWVDLILEECQDSPHEGILASKVLSQLNKPFIRLISRQLSAELRGVFLLQIKRHTVVESWSRMCLYKQFLALVRGGTSGNNFRSTVQGLGLIVNLSSHSFGSSLPRPVAESMAQDVQALWWLHRHHHITTSQVFILVMHRLPSEDYLRFRVRPWSRQPNEEFPERGLSDPWTIKIHVTNPKASAKALRKSIDQAQEQFAKEIKDNELGSRHVSLILTEYRWNIAD